MSYDLVVFDPRVELRDRATIMAWYDARTAWEDGLDYDECSDTTPALQRWFQEMIATFPPMNGRLRPADFAENDWTSDYSMQLVVDDLLQNATR